MRVCVLFRVAAFAVTAMTYAWAATAAEGLDLSSVGQPGDAAEAGRIIEVVLDDNFYELESLKVSRGETIRFVIVNQGEFLHEFNIATPQMHLDHQAEMMTMMEHGMLTATDFEPMPGHSHDNANSVLVRPGETAEIVWQFTEDAELEFACNVPGHYEAGMVGTIEFIE